MSNVDLERNCGAATTVGVGIMKSRSVVPTELLARVEAELTPGMREHAAAEFQRALEAAIPGKELWKTGRFDRRAIDCIEREVSRITHVPKLPNAGDRERNYIKWLFAAAADDSLVVGIRRMADSYAARLKDLLPARKYLQLPEGNLKLPGYSYVQKSIRMDSQMYIALCTLRDEAIQSGNHRNKWLASFLLAGKPMPVANFEIRCKYLVRNSRGDTVRLVELVNVNGERSRGPEVGGTLVLDAEAQSSAERFRKWCLGKGNFNFGVGSAAGTTELSNLNEDLAALTSHRVVNMVEYCGWYDLSKEREGVCQGLWFMGDCAYASGGTVILPDENGIIWCGDEGYVLMRTGRELGFDQGLPLMHPHLATEEVCDRFTEVHESKLTASKLGSCFRDLCRRLEETVGGMEAWMALGAVLAYAAAPEIFHRFKSFPGLWADGQMGGGKSTLLSWLMGLVGFLKHQAGLGLGSAGVSVVGMSCQLENYSNLPVWFDEFRVAEVGPEKVAVIRNCYNRHQAAKYTPDKVQRVIRTAPIVSGESTADDPATRSRFPHLAVSNGRRKKNHVQWFSANYANLFVFFRELLQDREEFVRLVLKQIDAWKSSPDTKWLNDRARATYSVSYAAFRAAAVTFGSHSPEELKAFHAFMVEHAKGASAEVLLEVNSNRFMDDLVTAYEDESLANEWFKVEVKPVTHPPGFPNQGPWYDYWLYFHPELVITKMQELLRRRGIAMPLQRRDLKRQLSQLPYWIGSANKRIGRPGQLKTHFLWGIKLDGHPLGTKPISDEALRQTLGEEEFANLTAGRPVNWPEGDPRCGRLHALVETWLDWWRAQERAVA